jgi:acyl-CoA synthetase (AMP-forming)/AMP-acid ligase II
MACLDESPDVLAGRLAKLWVPDDVVFLDALSVGDTVKVQKGALRKPYGSLFS